MHLFGLSVNRIRRLHLLLVTRANQASFLDQIVRCRLRSPSTNTPGLFNFLFGWLYPSVGFTCIQSVIQRRSKVSTFLLLFSLISCKITVSISIFIGKEEIFVIKNSLLILNLEKMKNVVCSLRQYLLVPKESHACKLSCFSFSILNQRCNQLFYLWNIVAQRFFGENCQNQVNILSIVYPNSWIFAFHLLIDVWNYSKYVKDKRTYFGHTTLLMIATMHQ